MDRKIRLFCRYLLIEFPFQTEKKTHIEKTIIAVCVPRQYCGIFTSRKPFKFPTFSMLMASASTFIHVNCSIYGLSAITRLQQFAYIKTLKVHSMTCSMQMSILHWSRRREYVLNMSWAILLSDDKQSKLRLVTKSIIFYPK